ncbi:hypothetical protein FQR65_LT08780 [Abscondita terminalis]|nr:hypothetical protein FQR65_LT08780 [Abscondita terminalis]
MTKMYLLLSFWCSFVSAQEQKNPCTFNHSKRTYFCSGITDQFPTMFYGAFNVKCTDCLIPVFRAGTFPTQSDVPSFNLTKSGIQNITTDAFTLLPKLNYLYLQHNMIFSIEPDAFATLQQLYELNLEHNQLGRLTSGIFNGINAVSVMLNHNYLKDIPENAFEGVKGIMALNISFNQIGILHMNSFKGLKNTEILDLQHNHICYIPLGLFQHLQVLKDLNLKGNRLRACVPGTFSGLKSLLSINLANNDFSEFDPSVMLPMGKISNLDISRNNLYYLDAHSVRMNAPTLRTLIINDNLWSCSILTNLIQYFKSVNIDTTSMDVGRYDVTNINGVVCSIGSINYAMQFEKYLELVKINTTSSVNYC